MAFVHSVKNLVAPVSIKARVQGEFVVELIHRSGIIKRRLVFPNLITDSGLNLLNNSTLSTLGLMSWVGVGTGSTEPAVTDTILDNQVGNRTNTASVGDGEFSNSGGSITWWERQISRLFDFAEANGNLTELGFFTAATGGTMFARQLFRDEFNDPTTITKTADDQLRIIYRYRIFIPTTDEFHANQDIGGNNYDVTVGSVGRGGTTAWGSSGSGMLLNSMATAASLGAASAVAFQNAAFPANRNNNAELSGSSAASTARSNNPAYVPGSFERNIEWQWGASVANFNIQGIRLHPISSPQVASSIVGPFLAVFDPVISKVDTHRLILRFRFGITRV
jgi:hypothetical protein